MILIIDERSARVLTAAREPGKVSPPRARRNINSADNEMGKYRLPRTFNRNALERLSADLDGRVIESVRSRLNRYTRCAIRSFLLSWGLSAGRSAPLHGTIRPTVVPYPPCARAFHYSIKPAHAPARTSEWDDVRVTPFVRVNRAAARRRSVHGALVNVEATLSFP